MSERKPNYRVTIKFLIKKRKWLFWWKVVPVTFVVDVYEFFGSPMARFTHIEGIDVAVLTVERGDESSGDVSLDSQPRPVAFRGGT